MVTKKIGKFAFCKEKQNNRGFSTVKVFECATLEEARAKMAIHVVGYIIDRSNGDIVASNRKHTAKKVLRSQPVGVLTKSAGWLVYR